MKRREFIYTTAFGGTIALSTSNLYADLPSAADPVTVIIQLAGGNDGLNTVIPIDNDYYYRARPKLAIKPSAALKLNDTTGLHPDLGGFRTLYETGQLAIVEGVGYPEPNRSHFRATEIWHTGSDADTVEQHGWLGRYFDTYCAGHPASVGLAIGKQNPQAFAAAMPTGVTFYDPRQLNIRKARGNEDLMMSMMGMDDADEMSGASIAALSGGGQSPVSGTLDPLAYLEKTATEARVSAQQIDTILTKVKPQRDYPQSRFAQELKVVSQLIRGGMPSKVYYLSRGGFDTHTNQAGSHASLMKEISEALLEFNIELENTGHNRRVAVMVYSEFGRRVKENASGGTDHGVAAPVFIIGGAVKGGFYGRRPDLAPENLLKGDLAHTTDYRRIYATLLEKHMKVDSIPVLLKKFQPLEFI
ncbi:DUF1501 domain-containing protein [Verrucomicrobia bacterium S94]|nr:DUF1501 domain-containing protein [Verrucomicrobia bacterium S94]